MRNITDKFLLLSTLLLFVCPNFTVEAYCGNMAGTYKMTTNHEEIKAWAIKNNARPAIIDHPQSLGDKVGIRLDFRGKVDEELLSGANQTRDISWDEFFRIFEKEELVFLYTEAITGDNPTDWYRFDKRHFEE